MPQFQSNRIESLKYVLLVLMPMHRVAISVCQYIQAVVPQGVTKIGQLGHLESQNKAKIIPKSKYNFWKIE